MGARTSNLPIVALHLNLQIAVNHTTSYLLWDDEFETSYTLVPQSYTVEKMAYLHRWDIKYRNGWALFRDAKGLVARVESDPFQRGEMPRIKFGQLYLDSFDKLAADITDDDFVGLIEMDRDGNWSITKERPPFTFTSNYQTGPDQPLLHVDHKPGVSITTKSIDFITPTGHIWNYPALQATRTPFPLTWEQAIDITTAIEFDVNIEYQDTDDDLVDDWNTPHSTTMRFVPLFHRTPSHADADERTEWGPQASRWSDGYRVAVFRLESGTFETDDIPEEGDNFAYAFDNEEIQLTVVYPGCGAEGDDHVKAMLPVSATAIFGNAPRMSETGPFVDGPRKTFTTWSMADGAWWGRAKVSEGFLGRFVPKQFPSDPAYLRTIKMAIFDADANTNLFGITGGDTSRPPSEQISERCGVRSQRDFTPFYNGDHPDWFSQDLLFWYLGAKGEITSYRITGSGSV